MEEELGDDDKELVESSSSAAPDRIPGSPPTSRNRTSAIVQNLPVSPSTSQGGTIASNYLSTPLGNLSWTLWQLIDSIFPTGGFAHSLGLEAAVQVGLVFDSHTLENFALSTLEGTGALLLPFVFAAHKCPTIECWRWLDSLLHATLTNQVVKRASTAQGTALLRVAAAVFVAVPQLKEMRDCARQLDALHVHHAPLFGCLCGLLSVESMMAQRAFLFLTLRDLLSAATRLNLVGPLEAAYMQNRLATRGEDILKKYANRSIQDAHQTAPVLDTIQGSHDQLFSRLFRS